MLHHFMLKTTILLLLTINVQATSTDRKIIFSCNYPGVNAIAAAYGHFAAGEIETNVEFVGFGDLDSFDSFHIPELDIEEESVYYNHAVDQTIRWDIDKKNNTLSLMYKKSLFDVQPTDIYLVTSHFPSEKIYPTDVVYDTKSCEIAKKQRNTDIELNEQEKTKELILTVLVNAVVIIILIIILIKIVMIIKNNIPKIKKTTSDMQKNLEKHKENSIKKDEEIRENTRKDLRSDEESSSITDELEKLDKLKKEGVISQDEFDKLKKSLLEKL